jgi:cyclase
LTKSCFLDSVASLYDRNNIFHVIRKASEQVFIPITIGGGIRNLADVVQALDSGADKIAINTAAVRDINFIETIAQKYGSQCIVGSIQAKKQGNTWEVYIESGRERTGINVVDWARILEKSGAGEILLTSVDKDGTKTGFDIELAAEVNAAIKIPLIVSGGLGKLSHLDDLCAVTRPSAICAASVPALQSACFARPQRLLTKIGSAPHMKNIAVLDYGLGNTRSVANALKVCEASSTLTAVRSEILACDGLIIPGVGRIQTSNAESGFSEFDSYHSRVFFVRPADHRYLPWNATSV